MTSTVFPRPDIRENPSLAAKGAVADSTLAALDAYRSLVTYSHSVDSEKSPYAKQFIQNIARETWKSLHSVLAKSVDKLSIKGLC
jgi:hypothetical protein